MTDRPLILGHRGSSALAPENTLAAFARAMEDGADGLEFDVRLARDGVPMVIHDATLNRTGLVNRRVIDVDSDELRSIDVGGWFHLRPGVDQTIAGHYRGEKIPTLGDVFQMFQSNSGVLYVEMKCETKDGPVLAEQVASLIQSMKMVDRVVVESFDLVAIARIKQIDPTIRTSALFEPKLTSPRVTLQSSRVIDLALKHAADELALHHTLARSRLIQLAHQRQLEVVVWTVDDVTWIERARSFGVKALIANNPAPLVKYRNGSG
jgi:glycerophosphoryl diester phosphodiesterase